MFDEATAAFKQIQLATVDSVLQGAGVPRGEIAKFESLQSEIEALVMTEIGVDMIIKEAIPIYASLFSEEELRGMIAFFESPAGRAWTQKAPEITTRMMQIVQSRLAAVVPKVLELIKKRLPPQQ